MHFDSPSSHTSPSNKPLIMAIRSVVFLLSLSAVSSWINAPLSRRVTELKAVVTLDGEVIRGEIAPVGNYVLVKTKDTLTATEGGILLPDQVRFMRNLFFKGTVLTILGSNYYTYHFNFTPTGKRTTNRGSRRCSWTR
jgi:hypothetical protein